MEKSCAEHGTFKDLCWSDYRLYKQFEAKNVEKAGRREIDAGSASISEYKGCPSIVVCARSMNHPLF